jgi:hypothetical protein
MVGTTPVGTTPVGATTGSTTPVGTTTGGMVGCATNCGKTGAGGTTGFMAIFILPLESYKKIYKAYHDYLVNRLRSLTQY